MQPLIECIPNFSVGRDAETIRILESAVRSIPGILFLDRHSDPDHNRTVITFAGSPEIVLRAAFESIRVAAERIDMRTHQGTHPRIGAADVVPFVPLSGCSLAECATLANHLGQRVGDQLGLPVYLYGAAAARPDRTALETIRQGGYETLCDSIATDPARLPDFGPARIGPAGAVAIGARGPLVAFNIFLGSHDVEIARRIARSVRTSSGGLPALKALGMSVRGLAQVSMNLTDYARTSLTAAYERVRQEAEAQGVSILHSEIIGLVPSAALQESAIEHLQLDPGSSCQILESRLAEVQQMSGNGIPDPIFLDQLSNVSPAPGSGSAAAYSAAMAAALIVKIASLTLQKSMEQNQKETLVRIREDALRLRDHLIQAATEDALACRRTSQMGRVSPGRSAMEGGFLSIPAPDPELAFAAQREVLPLAHQVLRLAWEINRLGFAVAVPDITAAARLAGSAVHITYTYISATSTSKETLPENMHTLMQEASAWEADILRLLPG
jgi:glutamate formiminotransferase